MTDELIGFEIAKLAKEKGFNENCDWFYNKVGKKSYATHYDATPNNKLDEDTWFSSGNIFYCSAPTQSLLQRWLREVHKCHISIAPYTSKGKLMFSYVVQYSGICKSGDNFDTYELALEEGLKQGLNLIK